MAASPLKLIQQELQQVQQAINKEMLLKGANLGENVKIDLDWLEMYFYPILLLLAARFFGVRQRAVPLACVVEFIYLAGHIHRQPGQEPAYPVLVGDYLYTQFFFYLCRCGAQELLAPLSAAICEVNEGGMLRLDLKAGKPVDPILVEEKEYGSLAMECCRASAWLGGATPQQAEILSRLGLNIALAWRLSLQGLEEAEAYLARARKTLLALPASEAREGLEGLLELLTARSGLLAQTAVV